MVLLYHEIKKELKQGKFNEKFKINYYFYSLWYNYIGFIRYF